MNRRIRENDIKKIFALFKYKKIKIQLIGFLKQSSIIENPKIVFLEDNNEIEIKNDKQSVIIKLSYVEDIYIVEKNKLKFLTDKELEILITFL